jgi:hypothetical protein
MDTFASGERFDRDCYFDLGIMYCTSLYTGCVCVHVPFIAFVKSRVTLTTVLRTTVLTEP